MWIPLWRAAYQYHETLRSEGGRLISPAFVPLQGGEGIAEVARSAVQWLRDLALPARAPDDCLDGAM